MSYEETLRREARRRSWKVEVRQREIGVTGIPCFTAPGVTGFCEVWVGVAEGTVQLNLSHDWQRGASHTANVRNLPNGILHHHSGEPFEAFVIHKSDTHCTLSRKLHGGDYEDAWHALNSYATRIYSLFLGENIAPIQPSPRPYSFAILGDQTLQSIEWRQHLADECVAIVGLGGVGAWIADFVVKADPREVHGWDFDCIEPKNILRMPGGVHPPSWINKKKADWFQETYSIIHRNVIGHPEKVVEGNMDRVLDGITFAFVAVDKSEPRTMVCNALARARIPFVVAGLAPKREHNRARIYIKIVTGHVGEDTWQDAIPTGDTGQDDYGTVDLPDVYAMAASWAIQAWRKMRGQFWQTQREECLTYRADEQRLTIRGVK